MCSVKYRIIEEYNCTFSVQEKRRYSCWATIKDGFKDWNMAEKYIKFLAQPELKVIYEYDARGLKI